MNTPSGKRQSDEFGESEKRADGKVAKDSLRLN